MASIGVRMDGASVVLDCTSIDLDAAIIEERVYELLPLLDRLFAADIAREALPGTLLERRFRAIWAQSMICEAALASAAKQAELLADITTGSESIADHGFPEFRDE